MATFGNHFRRFINSSGFGYNATANFPCKHNKHRFEMFQLGTAFHIISQLRLTFRSSDVELMLRRYVDKVVLFLLFSFRNNC